MFRVPRVKKVDMLIIIIYNRVIWNKSGFKFLLGYLYTKESFVKYLIKKLKVVRKKF